jgi:uncharacterized surface protein with fasciclin (FAS1) repeats
MRFINWSANMINVRNTIIRLTAASCVAAALIATTANAAHHEQAKADIVDTAVAAGDFTTLAAALQAGDLVGTLKSEGPFTVFAPTDAAFAKLPAGTVENLLKPENKDQLVAILTYHVVPGEVKAAQVVGLSSARTVNGKDLAVRVEGETVYINDARVTAADVGASNGVIHVIDTVLLPN